MKLEQYFDVINELTALQFAIWNKPKPMEISKRLEALKVQLQKSALAEVGEQIEEDYKPTQDELIEQIRRTKLAVSLSCINCNTRLNSNACIHFGADNIVMAKKAFVRDFGRDFLCKYWTPKGATSGEAEHPEYATDLQTEESKAESDASGTGRAD